MNLKFRALDNSLTINQYDRGGRNVDGTPLRLTLLKKVLLSAGWTVVASSNGSTRLVDGNDNSGSFTVNYSYVMLRDPGGVRVIGLQRGSDFDRFTIKYIAKDDINTATGSATVMCSATTSSWDKTIVSNVSVNYDAPGYIHCVADADAPYGFYCVMTNLQAQVSNVAVGFSMIFDPVTDANASDTDAVVIYVHRTSTYSMAKVSFGYGDPTNQPGGAMAWGWTGTANEAFTGARMILWAGSWTDGPDESLTYVLPYGLPSDSHRRYWAPLVPVLWGFSAGPKGTSTLCEYVGSGLPFGSVLTQTTTRDRITWGPIALKWVGEAVKP